MFGHRASSHTVWRFSPLMMFFRRRYAGEPGARTFNHSGLGWRTAAGTSGMIRDTIELLYRAGAALPSRRPARHVGRHRSGGYRLVRRLLQVLRKRRGGSVPAPGARSDSASARARRVHAAHLSAVAV